MATSKCTTYRRPVLKAYSPAQHAWLLFQPRCKMWSCPYCAQLNKQMWSRYAREGIQWYKMMQMKEWWFVTVTSHRKLKNLTQTLYVWPSAWGKLSRRMRYHFPGVRYILLPEQHEDSRLHIHMIVSQGVDTGWLKKHAPPCGLGYQAKGEPILDGWRAVFYVTKYLSKSLEHLDWPSHFRRIRTSQRWPKFDPPPRADQEELEWRYVSTYPSDGLEYLAEGLTKKHAVDYIAIT